jgi:predicted RNA-binding Zn ribbon-like protein
VSAIPPDDPGLRLCLALVNTYDLLANPIDRLTVDVAADLASRYAQPDLAVDLRAAGGRTLPDLVRLRGLLYEVFAAPTTEAKATAVDAVLARVAAVARMLPGPRLGAVSAGTDPVRRLAALCADALAQVITAGGADRLGTCVAHPCQCGFVDRTRPGRQRFCCQLCADRVAAAAYRARRTP